MASPQDPKKMAAGRMAKFTSIGECMVELAPGAQAGDLKLGFAGDTFNTAWYVKALAPDCQSSYVSCVGTDAVSDQMLAMMADAMINTDHVLRVPDRSVGLYLISLRDGERSFSYWRDNSAAKLLAQDAAALNRAIQGSDVVYFSGITLAILDGVGRATLLAAMQSARANGQTIVFDSNLRPRLWASPAEMTQAIMDAAAVSDIVLPSYDDEAEYFGDTDIKATRDRYRDAGAATVIVKNASGEIQFLCDGETGAVTPDAVGRVVDTTSAGDSFNAGFLVGLQQTGSVEAAIKLACKVAGHVIGRKGALVPLPKEGVL